tara:strand:+ start:178552 stop:178944 length:393 start_codon:yes stop_codon:yes gene_type:complete
MAFAIANSGIKYERLSSVEESRIQKQEESSVELSTLLERKFDSLRHKSLLLDSSVDTNEKLRYLTHSDNFEEALFLIDYLQDRFKEIEGNEEDGALIADIEFYLNRLEQNLDVVEKDLSFYSKTPEEGER